LVKVHPAEVVHEKALPGNDFSALEQHPHFRALLQPGNRDLSLPQHGRVQTSLVIPEHDRPDAVGSDQSCATPPYPATIGAASARVRFRVILMIPEIEVLFFMVPSVLERLTGRTLSPEFLTLARASPHLAFLQLLPDKAPSPLEYLTGVLTPDDVEALRETPPAKELIGFLTEAVENKAQPQPA
jgi:hypothetical protein